MKYESLQKIACIGIGGAGLYYVAKFFYELGVEVYGFDVQKTPRTQELESLGIKVIYENPSKPLDADTSLFVFAPGLPNELLAKLVTQNIKIPHIDVGMFTDELAQQYEANELTPKEKKAFISSNIAPLYTLDPTKMTYIAVTGTDGKTTTSSMIYHLLTKLGYKPGLITTVSAKIGNKDIDTGFHTTTPASQDLHKFIKMMEDEKCTHAIIETTSHALAMGRLAGLHFDAVAYTNITSEHLDYHKTWENYFLAKARLLTEHLKDNGFAIINADDPKSYQKLFELAQEHNKKVLSYGESTDVDYRITQISEKGGISFSLNGAEVKIPIIGKYNIWNAAAAFSLVSELCKKPLNEITQNLADFQTVTGRMQVLQSEPYVVIVDFAHTANALDVALQAVQSQKLSPNNKTIVVFGCAGKRDPGKRYPMGQAAGKYADITILTAEDPRSESLKLINDEIEAGWRSTADQTKHLIRFDDDKLLTNIRKEAIETALKLARPGDVILIAGKAHEESLCFGITEYPWSDISETQTLLKQMQ